MQFISFCYSAGVTAYGKLWTVSCCCGDHDGGFGRFLKIHNDFKVMKCKEDNSKTAVILKVIKPNFQNVRHVCLSHRTTFLFFRFKFLIRGKEILLRPSYFLFPYSCAAMKWLDDGIVIVIIIKLNRSMASNKSIVRVMLVVVVVLVVVVAEVWAP